LHLSIYEVEADAGNYARNHCGDNAGAADEFLLVWCKIANSSFCYCGIKIEKENEWKNDSAQYGEEWQRIADMGQDHQLSTVSPMACAQQVEANAERKKRQGVDKKTLN
jgi:hypothetical protein